jgi:hypothetical protein
MLWSLGLVLMASKVVAACHIVAAGLFIVAEFYASYLPGGALKSLVVHEFCEAELLLQRAYCQL